MGLNAHGDPGSSPTRGHFPIPLPISLQLASCLSSLSYPIKGKKNLKKEESVMVAHECVSVPSDAAGLHQSQERGGAEGESTDLDG